MILSESIISKRLYLFLLLLNLCFIGLHFSELSIEQEKQHVPFNHCKNQEFQCGNGQCIAKPFICDGIPDCEDGSDETYNLCRNTSCGEQYFQCGYGACIDKEYQCDGRQQCSDGSDERQQECENTKREFTRTKRASSGSCAVPSISLDKTINYYNCKSDCDPSSGYVSNMTVAIVSCKPNFHSEQGVFEFSNCFGGIWNPPIANCYKKCDKLNPINVNMRCTRNGIIIPCNENSLLAGSKVRPSCKPLHKYRDAVAPDYIEMKCNDNGKWNRRLFQCVPECGRSYLDLDPVICENTLPRISFGVQERYGDAPWHVAIYNSQRILICGGTIIHPYIVLSEWLSPMVQVNKKLKFLFGNKSIRENAAHCFDENNSGTVNNNTAEYEVVVSKMTRNYTVIDNNCQRVHKIKEIRASPKGYFGSTSYFTADIIALILEEKINIGSSVLPACVDWISVSRKTKIAEDTLGKVSGWGLNGTQNDPYVFVSEQLLTANLSFISRERCLRTVPDGFKDYVTFDKFCAGKEGGPGVLQGDSGGGFLMPQVTFQKETFYYLRGIVSLKDATVTPIAAFTDLADHYEWIIATRDEIDDSKAQPSKASSAGPSGESICNVYNVSNCVAVQDCSIANILIQSRKATYCGYDADDSEKICCKLPDIPQAPAAAAPSSSSTSPPTTTTAGSTINPPPPPPIAVTPKVVTELSKPVQPKPLKTSAEIVSSYCEEYSRYATDCINDVPPPKGEGKIAIQKEYPHSVRVACEYLQGAPGVRLVLVGTLISDQFVLSVADSICYDPNSSPRVKKIILGSVMTITQYNYKFIENGVEEYDIERSYIHPNYSFPHNAIVLHKTKTKVKFNSYMRPACIYTSNLDLINSEMRALGWGTDYFAWRDSRTNLKTSAITILDDRKCLENVTDSKSMICAGDVSDYNTLCNLMEGSSLQFLKENTSCMWTLYAIQHEKTRRCFFNSNTDERKKPIGFTKISYHLDWIQSIVWPEG